MSIQEALARPMDRLIAPFPPRIQPEALEAYGKRIEAGHKLLKESGVRGVLSELAEFIKPEFPDVALAETDLSLSISWNHQSPHQVDVVIVEAGLSDNLVVLSSQGEVLTREQWRSPEVLEDAIARGYRNPWRIIN